jgi:biotin-dependent carboxylase-like uncharacterized protein
LLGNHFNDAAVELTIGNVEWQALDDKEMVICGADMGFSIDENPIAMWQTVLIKEGEVLRCQTAKQDAGLRAVIAVKGGFQTQLIFGSRSVNLREQIGHAIKADETLMTSPFLIQKTNIRQIPDYFKPDYGQPLVLRLIPGYQYDDFTEQQIETLLSQHYLLNATSDRTGCRLHGQAIHNVSEKMTSEGVTYGSVEITTDGQPIILLKDRPTIGGYPKIGTVMSLDLSQLAQRQAGTQIKFELMTLEHAQQQRREFNLFFGLYN